MKQRSCIRSCGLRQCKCSKRVFCHPCSMSFVLFDQCLLSGWDAHAVWTAHNVAQKPWQVFSNHLGNHIFQNFAPITPNISSTRIKDASIEIRHSRERILFYTAGSRNEFGRCGYIHKRKLYLRKRYFFLIEKYIEDARQDEKHADLLEAIIQPPLVL